MGDGRTDTVVYDCAGLRIRSQIALAAPLDAIDGAIDLDVLAGDPVDQPFQRPSTDVVAELVIDGEPWYTFCRVDDTFVGRFFGVADFTVSSSLDQVVCHPVPGGRTEVIPIVIAGTVLAFVLAASGRYVLHGSAVDVGGTAIAFVGSSGQGKTTMAAVLCAAGAGLITDDILPLEFDTHATGTAVRCRRSTHELRLRPKAAELLARFEPGTGRRRTADDRHALAPETTPHANLPLGAIVLPRPDRTHQIASARRLGAGEAAIWLGRCQRVEGWREPRFVRQQFEDSSLVAAAVPVYEVWVPWGPPFAADLAEQVLTVCGFHPVPEPSSNA